MPAPQEVIHSLGIIPDGNRRWAERHGVSLAAAYRQSAHAFAGLARDLCARLPLLRHLAVYVFSTRNLQRRRAELTTILEAAIYAQHDVILPLCGALHMKVHMVSTLANYEDYGDLVDPKLCRRYLDVSRRLVDLSANNADRHLYLVSAYDPLVELDRMHRAYNCRELKMSDLLVPVRLDAVVRTAGEQRLSDFLPLQAGYAEFISLAEFFPDVDSQSVDKIIRALDQRIFAHGQ